MRKIALLLTLCIFCLFSGCIPSTELKDLAIVQAVGIDKENDQYILTLQLFYSEGAGGGVSFDPSKSNDKVVESRGATIGEAFKNAAINEGKEMFLSSNKLIVIGKEIAKENIAYPLDFFIKNHGTRPNVYVVMAEGEAREIVKVQIKQGIVPANFIESMLDASIKAGESQLFTLMDTMLAIQSKTQDIILPIIKKEKDENEQELVNISGSAIFKEQQLIDTISVNETIGITLANNQPIQSSLSVYNREIGKASVSFFRNHTKVKTSIVDGIPKFTFHITCKAKINETMEIQDSNMDMDKLEKIERLVSDQLKKDTEDAIKESTNIYNTNLLYLDDILRKQQPDYWKTNKDNFSRDISKFQFEVSVKTTVDRSGINIRYTNK